jgi:molybdopterin converting factor small subunit
MEIKILAFGIARDIIGAPGMEFTIEAGASVGELKKSLGKAFPKFGGLSSLAIAVNNEYAPDHLVIAPTDEIVLIPPVSGG